jgi:LysM repeat protein
MPLKIILLLTCFIVNAQAENLNSDLSFSLTRKDSKFSKGQPHSVVMSHPQGGQLQLLYTQDGLYVELRYMPIKFSQKIDGDLGRDSLQIRHSVLPMYHDYNGDGFKDYAVDLWLGGAECALFFIYQKKRKTYELVYHLSRAFDFDLDSGIYTEYEWWQSFGSNTYYFLVGNKWVEIAKLHPSQYGSSLMVKQDGSFKQIPLKRKTWLTSSSRDYNNPDENVNEWVKQNLASLWVLSKKEAHEFASCIKKSKQVPKSLRSMSRDNLMAITNELPESKLKSEIEKLAQHRPSIPMNDFTFYRVKKGDTLLKIAESQKIKLSDLLRLNDLKLDTIIYAGEDLLIPNL